MMRCPSMVAAALLILVGAGVASGQTTQASATGFQLVQRPGAVNLAAEYDLSNLRIPRDEIHTLLPRDAIPALTNPPNEPVSSATWLSGDARLVVARVGDDVLGVPISVLNWHEIVNVEVGGEPVAVAYCPLCDSASIFSRRVGSVGSEAVLEFGVSGALYNSNVLMYDRKERGLWSQLGMTAVSGPRSGESLRMMPVVVLTLREFKAAYPSAPVVSRQTGHRRDYTASPYEQYFKGQELIVPVARMGAALEPKTPGVGIAVEVDARLRTWFVALDAIGEARTIHTPSGEILLRRGPAGVNVERAPEGVRTVQTFYYAWSAFYPGSEVID